MDIKERMQAVIKAEAEAIGAIEVSEDFVAAVTVMQKCQGKILTTGIGKAGHIAKKFAATLCSTATPASFIHPAEAAHGDLGLVGQADVMIAFSTSGKSREVLEILEKSRHLGVDTIIGVTSHLDSELREHSDLILDMGNIEEPCPVGLTPSASMAVMLAISDALALALLEQKGVTQEDFGLRHHGGYLGSIAQADNEPR
ncbi:MAG TPA: capsule biosynthesis protein [Gammaproteobacteria bacterium]|nr:capsule biosynthesis protein [Gammaproteobacteria bacterium]HCG70748.1 capsule biosynthesis protein [Gammaproteobacteria bacterium]